MWKEHEKRLFGGRKHLKVPSGSCWEGEVDMSRGLTAREPWPYFLRAAALLLGNGEARLKSSLFGKWCGVFCAFQQLMALFFRAE